MPKIARVGRDYFVTWAAARVPIGAALGLGLTDVRPYGAFVDPSGRMLGPPEPLKTRFRGPTKLFTFPNGDAGWIDDVSGAAHLDLVRVAQGP
jgi:hypothetical protein